MAGSNANRSQWVWASPPSDDPEVSAQWLAESAQAGWLDSTGGMSAGETGSHDVLRCWGPMLAEWESGSACWNWGEAFDLEGSMTWGSDGRWVVRALDPAGRQSTLLDTALAAPLVQPPCLGWRVDCTSSNVQAWSMGWCLADSTSTEIPDEVANPETHAPTVREHGLVGDTVLAFITQEAWPEPLASRWKCPIPEGPVTVLARPTACENVWHVPLPCLLEPGSCRDVCVGDTVLQVWTDGTAALHTGDLAFTEIMADPTPSLHAPPSTFLEVWNGSDLHVDPRNLTLWDNGAIHALASPESRPHWRPGTAMLLVDDFDAWTDVASECLVVEVVGWPGLRDDGEQVKLLRDGVAVEDVTFDPSWWANTPLGGHSVSPLDPQACDSPLNWRPDPHGASPGQLPDWPQPLDIAGLQPPTSSRVDFFHVGHDTVQLRPSAPWDSRLAAWAQGEVLNAPSSLDGVFLHPEHPQSWLLLLPKPWLPAHPLHLRLVASACLPTAGSVVVDTVWTRHRPPLSRDIALTEVFPDPGVGQEFVEWQNISGDTLAWGTSVWLPGQFRVQSSDGPEAFHPWMTATWDTVSPFLWDVVPSLRLPNESGTVALHDPWGNVLHSAAYSMCDHDSPERAGQGRSVEWFPPAEDPRRREPATCLAEGGATPGWLGPLPESGDPRWRDDAGSRWGRTESHWFLDWLGHAPTDARAPDAWQPPCVWSETRHRGRTLWTTPVQHDELGHALAPTHVTHADWSCPPEALDEGAEGGVWNWNEWLQSPDSGHATFVELVLDSLRGGWTNEVLWTSKAFPSPADYMQASHGIPWWVPAGGTPCFATCPTWVDSDVPCIAAPVPSLHGDRELTLRDTHHVDEVAVGVEAHSPWVTDDQGLSVARVTGLERWATTPRYLGSTPGRPNTWEGMNAAHPHAGKGLRCAPQTLQPSMGADWTTAEWRMPLGWATNGATPCLVQWQAAPLVLAVPSLDRLEATVLGHEETHVGRATWVWDGALSAGAGAAPPGNYVLSATWVCESEAGRRRGVDRCLVTVSPP